MSAQEWAILVPAAFCQIKPWLVLVAQAVDDVVDVVGILMMNVLPVDPVARSILEPVVARLILAPVPELEIFNTAPEADAYDWVRESTFEESVQVPAVAVQLEVLKSRCLPKPGYRRWIGSRN